MLQLLDNRIASLYLFNAPFVPKTDKSLATLQKYRWFRSHTTLRAVSFDLEGDSARRVKPYAPVQEPFVSKGKLQDLELEQLSSSSNYVLQLSKVAWPIQFAKEK